MNDSRRYRKFQPHLQKIKELEENSPRFKRVYTEYQTMSDELWNLENSDGNLVTDDFINAVKLQTNYLEEEIEDWLIEDNIEE